MKKEPVLQIQQEPIPKENGKRKEQIQERKNKRVE